MYAQVYAEGHVHNIMEAILDYKKDASYVDKEDRYITNKSGQRRIQQTTFGWKLLVQCKNGTDKWIPLKDFKEYNSVEVAEFASSRGIESEPDFLWWIPFTLHKRDRIMLH